MMTCYMPALKKGIYIRVDLLSKKELEAVILGMNIAVKGLDNGDTGEYSKKVDG